MSPKKIDKPVLYMVGARPHEDLWKKLNETFALAFLNSNAAQVAASKGMKVIALQSFMTPQLKERTQAQGIWIAGGVMDAITQGWALSNDHDSLHGHGLGSWLPVWTFSHFTAALARVVSAAECMDANGAAGVLVHEDVTPDGRAMAMFGIAEKIPTMHIPHANHFLPPDSDDIHTENIAPLVGCAGEYMKSWYEVAGNGSCEFTLLGVPNLDRYYDELYRPSKEFARNALGLPQDETVICIATTWTQKTYLFDEGEDILEKYLRRVLEICKEKKYWLLVKIHPGEWQQAEENYTGIMNEYDVKGTLTRRYNHYALSAADVLICFGPSNISVEAGIFECPTLHLSTSEDIKYPDYGPPLANMDNLETVLHEVMGKRVVPTQEFVQKMNYDNDGKAVERCVEWVREKTGV